METSKWLDNIDKITIRFHEAFGDLSADQLAYKPDEHSWSIEQNMEHLIQINESYFPAIEALQSGEYSVPFIGKVFAGMVGNLMLKAVQPDNKRKVNTFAIWKPTGNHSDILQAFSEHQSELKKVISDSEDLLKKGVFISSPTNKYIVYKLDKAFDIIVAHEQRHFEQAKNVLGKLKEA